MARNKLETNANPPETLAVRAGPGPWEAQLRKGALEMAALAALWNGRLYGLEKHPLF